MRIHRTCYINTGLYINLIKIIGKISLFLVPLPYTLRVKLTPVKYLVVYLTFTRARLNHRVALHTEYEKKRSPTLTFESRSKKKKEKERKEKFILRILYEKIKYLRSL